MAAAAAAALGAFLVLRVLRTRPPNLLLITVDTLRADHVGAYGGAAPTPALDGLARRGARFARAQAAVPITGPSHATLLTGLYPPSHGVRDNVRFALDARHPTLASILKERGFRTGAVIGAYPLASGFGFGQGFETFDERLRETPAGAQGAERGGDAVAEAALAFLAADDPRPFFLWAHFYDPHTPYDPPSPYRESYAGRLYAGEVAYADAQLGRLLDALRASGREPRTVVAAAADHGEGLGAHGEATHAVLVYESTLHVPFLLAGPGVPAGTVVADQVGLVDVLPTVLRLLGVAPPPGLPGRDLAPALRGERLPAQPLYAESLFGRINCRWSSLRAWTHDGWKLIDGAAPELYRVADDPGETRDHAAGEAARVARMREALHAAVQRMAPGGDSARPRALSAEQEERLRSLGYAAGPAGAQGAPDAPGLPDPRTHVGLFERLQALTTARGGQLAAAAQEAAAIAARDPGNPFAHFTAASVAYRAGDLEGAGQAFARALALEPDAFALRASYGTLLRERGALAASEKELRVAQAQSPAGDDAARIALAETLSAAGKWDEADRLLDEVLSRAPSDRRALLARGRLRFQESRMVEAVADLERAQGDDEAAIALARAWVRLGGTAQAEAALAGVLRGSPGHPWALAVLAHARANAGRRAEALALLGRAESARPRRADAWLTLAEAYAAAGEPAAAARARQQARGAERP
jgi:arylsulfatase A-like enzyme/tetratricopeptide (TPR) repeat protein